jgi:hypothetical protein
MSSMRIPFEGHLARISSTAGLSGLLLLRPARR